MGSSSNYYSTQFSKYEQCLGIFEGMLALEYLLIVWSFNPIGAEILKFCTRPGQSKFKEKNLKSLSCYTNVGLTKVGCVYGV